MTVTIGMLRQFSKPNQLVLAAAHAAKMIDSNFFFFHPTDVNFENRKIMGLFYEDGEWVRRETEFPDVVDNSPSRREYREIFNRLSKEVPFTMRRIGNKDVVNNRIKQDGVFAKYIIPSNKITSVEDILAFLKEYDAIVVKPAGGNRGKGIHFIAKTEEGFILNVDSVTKEIKREEMQDHLAPLIKRSMIVQPFIQSVTKEGLPFDIRLHVRRGMEGKWKTVKIYPRIGSGDGIVSNLSQGGSIGRIRPFLKRQFGEKWLTIWKELNELASAFPNYFQKSYDEPLDALGLDIGIDSDGRLWLFEVNSFPGSTMFELEAQQVAMQYAKHLALIHKKDLLKVDALKKGARTDGEKADKEERGHQVNDKPVIAMLSPAPGGSKLKRDCAMVAPYYQVEFCHFTPKDIDLESSTVTARTLVNGRWVNKTYDLNQGIDVIYDRLRRINTRFFKETYEALKHIPNTHPHYGESISKLKVYDQLSEVQECQEYLIPYIHHKDVSDSVDFIERHKRVILKPSVGLGGSSLCHIEQMNANLYRVIQKGEIVDYSLVDFKNWIESYTKREDFVIQKYIKTRTIDGAPFDIRAHLLRDVNAEWKYAAIYPRIGLGYEKITPITEGGYIGKTMGFLKRNYGEDKAKKIDIKIRRAAKILTRAFEKRFSKTLSEVGLDFAIDEKGEVYLLEINVRRPGIHYYEFDVARLAIGYASSLHSIPNLVTEKNLGRTLRNEELPHLTKELVESANVKSVSGYAMLLEAWRRGLEVTVRKKRRRTEYIFSDGNNTYIFDKCRGSKTTARASEICVNKNTTHLYLKRAGVPVADSIGINQEKEGLESVLSKATDIGYPVVLKPTFGTAGQGVFVNLKNKKDLLQAYKYLIEHTKYTKFTLESYKRGVDHRVFVLGDRVVASIKRVQMSVIGDGESKLIHLINLKNKQREKNIAQRQDLIKVTPQMKQLVQSQGFTLDDVVPKGKKVLLKEIANGGDIYDSTQELSKEAKQCAVNAVHAIPGLHQAGVDLLVTEENGEEKFYVLEVNSRPNLVAQLFPGFGKARDIPSAILDDYFPSATFRKKDSMFFNHQSMINKLKKGGELIFPKITNNSKLVSLKLKNLEENDLKIIKEEIDKKLSYNFVSKDGGWILNVLGESDMIKTLRSFLNKKKIHWIEEELECWSFNDSFYDL